MNVSRFRPQEKRRSLLESQRAAVSAIIDFEDLVKPSLTNSMLEIRFVRFRLHRRSPNHVTAGTLLPVELLAFRRQNLSRRQAASVCFRSCIPC
jgi:hypothetical protein